MSNLFALIIGLLVLSTSTQPLCNTSTQCRSVTQKSEYVECNNATGRCECLTAFGFSGNATLADKCRCLRPSEVFETEDDVAYCFLADDMIAAMLEKKQENFQLSIVRAVYESLLWPTPRAIMIELMMGRPGIVYNYFADNASGRVDPLGLFSSHEGIVEYLYGLFWSGAARCRGVVFKKLISQNNIVHINVHLLIDLYDQTQQNVVFTYNLTQSGSYSFDRNGLIFSTDLVIHNLGQISNPQLPPSPESIGAICYLILNVAHCNATNDPSGYYTDFADCAQSFGGYQWGSWDNLYFNGNSTTCRFFHALLATARPDNHCSHAGKTGGGKCISHDYTTYYNRDY